jgi:NTP pyrophosphatase (non-canonical NTP hydrolase)
MAGEDAILQPREIMSDYTFSEYASKAASTALYPGRKSFLGVMYCALGAAGEAGEIANKVKKIMRDDGMVVTPEKRDALKREVGDVLWYLSQLAYELEFELGDSAQENNAMLASRKERGTIHGSGDNR